jgi:glucose-1-phosphate cytidylyltransferase
MKTVILCGGLGTRLREETEYRPKPMVDVGGRPILWHIMKSYAHYGFCDFVLCLGYRGNMIKEYFLNYEAMNNDFTICLGSKSKLYFNGTHKEQDFRITLVDTGQDTMTGGRLRRVRQFMDDEEFFLTYGDGVADIDIRALLEFHRGQKVLATVTSVRPPGRFGALVTEGSRVLTFQEKPAGNGWINGGFFVLSPSVIDLIDGDHTVWEGEPLERLARQGQLAAYAHEGFWHPMDTLRDKNQLDELWKSGKAPWKVWE